MQTGLLAQTYGVNGGTISLTPTNALKPGELVQVSATTGTLSLASVGPGSLTVWGFRVAATVGPATTTVGGGNAAAFTITFGPAAVGSFTDTVNIASNDANENPYTFVISGAGLATMPTHTLTVNITGSGRVDLNPPGTVSSGNATFHAAGQFPAPAVVITGCGIRCRHCRASVLCQEFADSSFQGRDIYLDNVPDDAGIDVKVSVDQAISQTNDLFPG
jgi:hypothetical protein